MSEFSTTDNKKTKASPIRVMLVDDSNYFIVFFKIIFESVPGFVISHTANSGDAALRILEKSRPDIILMDLNMPGMDGLEATRHIMMTNPLPIVIISAMAEDEVQLSFDALKAGALAAFPKPTAEDTYDNSRSMKRFFNTLRSLSSVKLVKRRNGFEPFTPPKREKTFAPSLTLNHQNLIVIGASTGGPPAISALLAELPADFIFPVLIVQHIATGFIQGFADWLGSQSKVPVVLAKDEEEIQPCRIYLAPDGNHLGIGENQKIELTSKLPLDTHCPSVTHLFQSALEIYENRTIAILLTGMGMDGSEKLKDLRDVGATTIAQNEESSVIFGMPGKAIELNAAQHILNPIQIGRFLADLSNKLNSESSFKERRKQTDS